VQLGTENRRKTLIVSLGLLLAVLIFLWRMSDFFGGGSSAPDASVTAATVEPPSVTPGRRPGYTRGKARPVLRDTLDPRLRLDLLKSSEEVKYAGTGRNIFLSQAEPEIPKPVQSGRLQQKQQEQERDGMSTPPPPPPIQLKFYGFANKPGEPRRVFLAKGDDIFIAGEGEIVDRRYKVLRIGPTAIEVQDVLNPANRQSIPITQG
jgi:hypothetical protein